MKTKFIINGDVQLIIIPQTDRERELLALCKGATVEHLNHTAQILGEVVTGSILLTSNKDK